VRYSKTLRLKQDNAGCYQRMEVNNRFNFINTVGSRRIKKNVVLKKKKKTFTLSYQPLIWHNFITERKMADD